MTTRFGRNAQLPHSATFTRGPDRPVGADPAENDACHRYESGIIELTPPHAHMAEVPDEEAELDVLAEHTIALLRDTLGNDLALELDLRAEGAHVPLAAYQVQHLLSELARSACQAMSRGGSIRIETRVQDGLGATHDAPSNRSYDLTACVRLRLVPMQGKPSRPQMAPCPFTPLFARRPEARLPLNLAATTEVLRRAASHIALSHMPDRTSLELYLPCRLPAARLPASPRKLGPAPAEAATIVVADDEPAVRQLVARVLRDARYRVLETCNARDAIRVLANHLDEVVALVSDVEMPVTSGPELICQARLLVPSLPALLMSGTPRAALVQDGRITSDTELLEKPFRPSDLIDRVRRMTLAAQVARGPLLLTHERNTENKP